MRYLGIDPGLRRSLGFVIAEIPLEHPEIVRILEAAIINLESLPLRVAASKLLSASKTYRVSEVLIEDFMFFRDKDKKEGKGKHRGKATWFVVARMQRMIGYLCGFFSSSGIPVDVVAPRRWKARVKEKELNRIVQENGIPENPHILSALGVILGELKSRACGK